MVFWTLFLLTILILVGRYHWRFLEFWIPSFVTERKRFALAIILIIIIATIRYGIGFDWFEYKKYVETIRWHNWNIDHHELLSYWILRLGILAEIPIGAFGGYAFLTYGIFGICIDKYSQSRTESLIVYLGLFFLDSLSIVRQALAVVILLYGYKYIKEKKIVPYILVCVLATLVHQYAAVGILIYFVYNLPQILVLAFELSGTGLILIAKRLIQDGVLHVPQTVHDYLFDWIANSSGKMTLILYWGIITYCILLMILRYRNGLKNDSEVISMLLIVVLGALFPLCLGTHTGSRVAYYFLIYFVLIIPKIHDGIVIWYRKIAMCIYYAYFYVFLFISVVINESTKYIPYRTYWYH